MRVIPIVADGYNYVDRLASKHNEKWTLIEEGREGERAREREREKRRERKKEGGTNR